MVRKNRIKGSQTATAVVQPKAVAVVAKPAPGLVAEQQILPPKQATLFKLVVKCYETKQYKKGIKTADAILKSHQYNGETLAMKGLILNCLHRKTEAIEFIKQGLKSNVRSHVCWHVYGLFHRSNQAYPEAIKSYLNALHHDPYNVQILRDLSLLQVQIRDVAGFEETRRKILVHQSANRLHWIAYAVSAHLAGHQDRALQIMCEFEQSLPAEGRSFEHSERLLYKLMLQEEIAEQRAKSDDNQGYVDCLSLIETISSNVTDQIELEFLKGKFLIKLERFSEAKGVFERLIQLNPDNTEYHSRYIRCIQAEISSNEREDVDMTVISDGSQLSLVATYEKLMLTHPYSNQCEIQSLKFTTGSIFENQLDSYMIKKINKGMISLYHAIRFLYSDADKTDTISSLIEEFLRELPVHNRFRKSAAPDSANTTAYFWTLFFAAQHFDHLGQYARAIECVAAAELIDATCIDTSVVLARIYKHAGDLGMAHDLLESARSRDVSDRYLNTKCVRYAMRAGRIDEGERVVSLFLRDGNDVISLFDMQCIWFELAQGMAFVEQKAYGKALKKFEQIQKHFIDIIDDQFDFHTYCLRKMTLRAYVRMLRFEDTLQSHRFYTRASFQSAQVYIDIFDSRQPADPTKFPDFQSSATSAEDKRRAALKAKREQAKRDKQKAKAGDVDLVKIGSKPIGGAPKVEDPDPHGDALQATSTPLVQAQLALRAAEPFVCGRDLSKLHLLYVELYQTQRIDRPLLLLRSLLALQNYIASHESDTDIHRINCDYQYELVRFHQSIVRSPPVSSIVMNVIEETAPKALSPRDLIASMKQSTDYYSRYTAARIVLLLNESSARSEVADLCDPTSPTLKRSSLSVQLCSRVHYMIGLSFGADAAGQYRTAAYGKFPFATLFSPDQ